MNARLTRALMSDHRRNKQDAETAADVCFLGLFVLIVIGALLKLFGVIG